MNSTDFFSWDNGNFSTILWQNLNSQSALDVYFWIAIVGIFFTFVWPFLGPLIGSLIGLSTSIVYLVITKRNERNIKFREIRNAKLRRDLLNFGHLVGRVWHGYEVFGWENIPKTATIFVLHHGALSADGIFLFLEMQRRNIRPTYGISDKTLVEMKIWKDIHRDFNSWACTREDCLDILAKDYHLLLAPGGIEESRYSKNYRVHFGSRQGFARLALDTKATVIPVFTRNIQEAYWIPWFTRPFVSGWFAPKRLKLIPAGGGLPVKLTTFIGKPIEYEETFTVDQLTDKVKVELQQLIDKHQRLPGNRLFAIFDRFRSNPIKSSDKKSRFTIV